MSPDSTWRGGGATCRLIAAAAIAAGLALPRLAWATTYRFSVSCSDKHFVAEWDTGTIDPGKEYLRVQTGTKNGGCSVGEYDAARDSHLTVEKYSGATGVIQGIPFIGPLICHFLFGC